MGFRNSILAGLTLIREAIRSQNYDPGVAGWAINADGTAEFSDLTVRSSNGSGDTIELVNGEVLVFDNGVLVGKLSASIPGLLIGAAGLPQVSVYSVAGIGRVEFDANSPATGILAALTMAIFNAGGATENLSLQLQGPGVTGATDRVEFLLDSQNNDGTSQANIVGRVAAGPNLFVWDRTGAATFVRWVVSPPASAQAALWVDAAAAHSGSLILATRDADTRFAVGIAGQIAHLPEGSASQSCYFLNVNLSQTAPLQRLQKDSSDKYVVDANGVLSTYAGNSWNTYTPVISGGGTATFSTLTGYWQRTGKRIDFVAYFAVNVAGSGAGTVSITTPTNVDRSTRQSIPMHADGITATQAGPGCAVCFVGGSGTTIDRLRARDNTNITGANLLAGAIVVIEGFYREA